MNQPKTQMSDSNTPASAINQQLQNDLAAYIQSLTEKEHKAYLIAKSHLGSSFQLEKSNGFLKWKSDNATK